MNELSAQDLAYLAGADYVLKQAGIEVPEFEGLDKAAEEMFEIMPVYEEMVKAAAEADDDDDDDDEQESIMEAIRQGGLRGGKAGVIVGAAGGGLMGALAPSGSLGYGRRESRLAMILKGIIGGGLGGGLGGASSGAILRSALG